MSTEYHHLAVTAAQIHVVDLGHTLLGAFSDEAHDYVAKVLGKKGVRLHLGVAVTEIGPGHVTLADGSSIRTRCVIWGGGIMAPPSPARPGCRRGAAGASTCSPTSRSTARRASTSIGDVANIPSPDGRRHPQLGSVALQSGVAAADNLLADFAGKPRKAFHYHDKGIMAMIGRGAAVAEVGPHRHELHGVIAFSSWLGVHAMLMTGVRNRIDAFVNWGWDYFGKSRGPQVLDRSDAARIDWEEDAAPEPLDGCAVTPFAVTTVDLARVQFAMTSIYHFLFVPLTLGPGAAGGDHADARGTGRATTRGCG